jgi:hypothetical protein
MIYKNLSKGHIIENNMVNFSARAGTMKKKGKKMRQNFSKLLKTIVGKISIFRLSTMSMKTKVVR